MCKRTMDEILAYLYNAGMSNRIAAIRKIVAKRWIADSSNEPVTLEDLRNPMPQIKTGRHHIMSIEDSTPVKDKN